MVIGSGISRISAEQQHTAGFAWFSWRVDNCLGQQCCWAARMCCRTYCAHVDIRSGSISDMSCAACLAGFKHLSSASACAQQKNGL